MQILHEFQKICAVFEAAGIEYALCGGLAVALHGFPRFTRDIDLLIREENLETVRSIVATIGFDLETGWIRFHGGTPDEERLFRLTKTEGTEFLTLDLMLVTPSLQETWDTRVSYNIDGHKICVVSKQGLIAMKRAAGRPVDLQDIALLESSETAE